MTACWRIATIPALLAKLWSAYPTIREDTSTTAQLLFDADHSLEERIIAEQFLG